MRRKKITLAEQNWIEFRRNTITHDFLCDAVNQVTPLLLESPALPQDYADTTINDLFEEINRLQSVLKEKFKRSSRACSSNLSDSLL